MLPATPIIQLGEPLIELPSIDSTNIYAIQQIHQGLALSGSCYRADFQTHGKGQLAKSWGSDSGQNLLSSHVLNIKQLKDAGNIPKEWNFKQQFGLSVAIALGVSDYFGERAGEETKIKWPNDLYWRDRKAGGILIENIMRGTEWNWSIIGIGLNINQTSFSFSITNQPVSLKQITGKHWELREQMKALSKALTHRVNEWATGNFEQMLTAYNERLFKKGETMKFKQNNIQFSGKVIGVNQNGQLILDQGIEQYYNFGEIIWELGVE